MSDAERRPTRQPAAERDRRSRDGAGGGAGGAGGAAGSTGAASIPEAIDDAAGSVITGTAV